MCHRSINYVAEMMEKKFGIPWIKVNFVGAEGTAKSLRHIAQYFNDAELTERVEKVISEEMTAVLKTQFERALALRRQDGHAVRGRLARAPLPDAVRGDGHEDRGGRLRVRPSRRLRRPARAADHQGGRRQPEHRGTARGPRRRATGRARGPGRARASSKPPRAWSSRTTRA
jgi:hypothetical protein